MIRSTNASLAHAVAFLAAAGVSFFLVFAARADAATTWICNPQMPVANNVCLESQKVTTFTASGGRSVSTPSVPSNPKFDCFYVYPTTSDEPTAQADFQVTPELSAIARNQASPYSRVCKVYVPVYRQITVKGLLDPSLVTGAMREQAYQDVLDAWRDFLANHSKGRPFMVVGHSQGTFVLRRLIAQEIDPVPSLRKRLVSAHLTGGNVLVAKNSKVGGDFKNIPACTRSTQTGCVVAYSSFNSPVPDVSKFGRAVATPWDPTADPSTREVLCTNPAKLGGGSGNLQTLNNRKGFPGIIGLAIGGLGRVLPSATTLWVAQPFLYSAQCVNSNGANVLMVSSRTSQSPLIPSPDASWGLHLGDMNLALGNLLSLAKSEGTAWHS